MWILEGKANQLSSYYYDLHPENKYAQDGLSRKDPGAVRSVRAIQTLHFRANRGLKLPKKNSKGLVVWGEKVPTYC